jgi:glutamine amidotransferase/cyclase
MVQKGNVVATQFHPEKSGAAGLAILGAFLARGGIMAEPGTAGASGPATLPELSSYPRTQLVKRVIACLDVRSNDAGDLVVTKGDQYDVREAAADGK